MPFLAVRFLKQYAEASNSGRPKAVAPDQAPMGTVGTLAILTAVDPFMKHLTAHVVRTGRALVPGSPSNDVA